MKIDTSQNSEHGNFKLIPEEGMKLRSFIDYDSKLLVISESLIDTSHLPSQHGMRIIPSEQFIVDPLRAEILKPSEWKKYFNYEVVETNTPDGKLKEFVQRIHEPERNTDSLDFSLLNLETNEYIFKNGSSIAFQEKPRDSSAKRYYESLESQKKYLKSLELGKYPIDNHKQYLNELSEGDSIIQYFNDKNVFELFFTKSNFILHRAPKPNTREEWESLDYEKLKSFINLIDFWKYLTIPNKSIFSFKKNSNWYSNYTLRVKSRSIEKFIIEEHNNLVKNNIIPYERYQELNSWMNINYNQELERNVFWQFCSNCKERVLYNPRYPNHACRKCVDMIRDSNGNKLDYRDIHKLKYEENGFKVLLKQGEEEVKIFIEQIEYLASEAKFGGIVHQIKE